MRLRMDKLVVVAINGIRFFRSKAGMNLPHRRMFNANGKFTSTTSWPGLHDGSRGLMEKVVRTAGLSPAPE